MWDLCYNMRHLAGGDLTNLGSQPTLICRQDVFHPARKGFLAPARGEAQWYWETPLVAKCAVRLKGRPKIGAHWASIVDSDLATLSH